MNIVLNKPEEERSRYRMGDEPGKLFIGAVSSQVQKEEFRSFFEEFGEVSDCVLMIDKDTNRNKGFGFVTYKDPACSTKLLQSGPLKLGGRIIDPKPSVQRGQLPPAAAKPPPNRSLDKKVFVGGISQSTDEEGLRNYFNSHSFLVKEVVLMHDNQTLKSRGFAFVTFIDDATVESVCRQRFFNIDNKTVECKKAEPRGGKNEMGGDQGGGPGGNYNQMQRGGPPNMGQGGGGGFNQSWNQNPNPGYGGNQFGQGPANYQGWGGQQQPPMGNFQQPPPQQQAPQQQGFGPSGGQMPNQGGFGGQYNGNSGYNQQQQQQRAPQPQQGGYGYGQQAAPQQQQQQQAQPQQAAAPQQQGNYVPPQNYNYNNYPAQQPQARQPETYPNQTPPAANQGYNAGTYGTQNQGYGQNAGNMGNYAQEASGYGPQRVNYSAPAQGNFNPQQAGGYGGDMSGGFAAAPAPQQQQAPPQNYQQPHDTSQDMYSGGARGNNAAVPFHPYRR